MNVATALNTLRIWWAARAAREQWMLGAAAALVGGALVYSVALAPALRVAAAHAATGARLQAQWQTMVQLQAQAQALQSQPRPTADTVRSALQASVQPLGTQADVAMRADGARVNLRNIDAQTLATWLANARTQAGSVPLQANLTRTGTAWSGSLLMSLPAP